MRALMTCQSRPNSPYPQGKPEPLTLTIHANHPHPPTTLSIHRDMRRRGHVNEFVHVHIQGEACYVSCDGGRVCRPLIICDRGVPRVKQEHISKIKSGEDCSPSLWKRIS